MQQTQSKLHVRNLRCERQRRILFDDLSFSVGAGEVLRIAGNNGTGKTTLLKILTGLYEDYEGEVSWDLDAWPLFVSHKPGVKDQLTALENLSWLTNLQGASVNSDALGQALAVVGLTGFEDTLCGSMSEGQRKRVNLARLFLLTSPAWILDEPFSAIDAEGVTLLESRLSEYVQQGGIVILTSHQSLQLDQPVTNLTLASSR